uniref:Uncharacterized protein n=1 Tax=Panagrellus redivivus TaxID=6233 RepID=A0A7E4VWD4_PANRE
MLLKDGNFENCNAYRHAVIDIQCHDVQSHTRLSTMTTVFQVTTTVKASTTITDGVTPTAVGPWLFLRKNSCPSTAQLEDQMDFVRFRAPAFLTNVTQTADSAPIPLDRNENPNGSAAVNEVAKTMSFANHKTESNNETKVFQQIQPLSVAKDSKFQNR